MVYLEVLLMQNEIINEFNKKYNSKYIYVFDKPIPAWYSSVNDEYVACKETSALFFRADLRQVFISGEDRNRLIDKVTTVDLSKIEFYNVVETAMCDEEGKVVDILKLYIFGDGILLLSNFFKTDKVLALIEKEKGDLKCDVMEMSDKSSIYTFIGPSSTELMKSLIEGDPASINDKQFSIEPFNENEIIISKSEDLGKVTYEVITEKDSDEFFLGKIDKLNDEKPGFIKPMGYIAYNIIRIEKGLPSVMNEFNQNNLIEADMNNIIFFDKVNFIGKDAIANQKETKRTMFLCNIDTDLILPYKQNVLDESGKKVGYLTSSAYSPYLMKTIAIGFIKNAMNSENNEIYFKIGRKHNLVKGKIMSPIK